MRLSNQNRVIKRMKIGRFKVTKDYEGEGEIPLTLLESLQFAHKGSLNRKQVANS